MSRLFRFLVLFVAVALALSPNLTQAQSTGQVTLKYWFTNGDSSTFYLESTTQPVETAPSITYDDGTTITGGKWSYNSRVWYSYIKPAICGSRFSFHMQGNFNVLTNQATSLGDNKYIVNDYQCPPIIRIAAVHEAAPGQNIAVYGYKFTEGYTGTNPENDFQVCFDDNQSKTCVNGPAIQFWKENSVRLKIPSNLTSGQEYSLTVKRGNVSSSGKSYKVGNNTFPEGANRMVVGYDGPTTNRLYAMTDTTPDTPNFFVNYGGSAYWNTWKFDGIDWFGHLQVDYCNKNISVRTPNPAISQVLVSNLTHLGSTWFLIEAQACRPHIQSVYPSVATPGSRMYLGGNNFLNGRTGSDDSGLSIVLTGPDSEVVTLLRNQTNVWNDTYISLDLPTTLRPKTAYQLRVYRDSIVSDPQTLLVSPYQVFLPALVR